MSGASGERVDYMRRADGPGDARGVEIYSRDLGGVSMEQLSTQLRQTRRLVNEIDARDLRRGFTLTLLVLLGAAWLVSLLPLVSDRPPREPADPAAHRGADRFCRWRLVAEAGDRRETWRAALPRATRWVGPSTRSTTWRINSRRTASGSCT